MGKREGRALGLLGVLLAVAGFASCTSDDAEPGGGGAGAGAGGEGPSPVSGAAGKPSAAGSANEAGAGNGGRATELGGAGGVSEAGPGGVPGAGGVSSGSAMCAAGGEPGWWNSSTKFCQDCSATVTIECDEVEAGSSYDVDSSTLTVHLPPGRVGAVEATIESDFTYANGDPEQYAWVSATIAGDTLTFDFSEYAGSGLSYLGGSFNIKDGCGESVRIHAQGAGFGPAVLIDVDGSGGAGGGSSEPRAVVSCGHTN